MSQIAGNTVLVVDDQTDVLNALQLLFKSEGIGFAGATCPSEALQALKARTYSGALLDLNYSRDATSGEEGLDLLDYMRQFAPEMPVVVMTGWGSVDLAVQAIRRGASDFIEKPWSNGPLMGVLRTHFALSGRAGRQRAGDGAPEDLQGALICESPAMRRVMSVITRVASSEAAVLLLGENGTGKGLVAHYIHDHSQRSSRAFVKVNMGGVAESVFESEMFGHMRGAFTDAHTERVGRFEAADGGTLFLDEIGNAPPSQQAKLLRVLESGEFERLGSSRTQRTDARVISATNSDLAGEVMAGRFRMDLLYRLNTVEIHLPPLRERTQDIVPLARSFLEACAQRYNRSGMRLSPAAERALTSYSWPGNVRQLGHMMERAVLLAEHDELGTAILPFGNVVHLADDLERMTLDEAEKWLVQRSLHRHSGNLRRSADALGLTRQSLYRRLEKFGLRTSFEDDE